MIEEKHLQSTYRWLNWSNIRDLSIVASILVVAWKLVVADFQFDFSGFNFSELLALLLALFSVWLSVMFYFKANDASSQFYDNTYKFTSETSQMLGRIEAGFGERLRHLDEGYRGIHQAMFPSAEAKKRVNEGEEAVNKIENELWMEVQGLTEKAALADNEKQEILARFHEIQAQLNEAQDELSRRRMDASSRMISSQTSEALSIAANAILAAEEVNVAHAGPGDIQRAFQKCRYSMPKRSIEVLRKIGMLNTDQSLSMEGLVALHQKLIELSNDL